MAFTRRDFIRQAFFIGSSLFLPKGFSGTVQGKEGQWRPAYENLEREGRLAQRIDQAYAILEHCVLCPRQCGVNRLKGEEGFCRSPSRPVIYSAHPHFGEEISLVGKNGSGTIFFSNCNLRCVFCQNWPIAHEGRGREVKDEEIAGLMIQLQKMGCHNINLVTPTHVMPHILNATRIALKNGLNIPLVYNTSGYERIEIIRLLDGIVDIYLPDMKYMDADKAAKYSADAADYPEMAKAVIIEMNRQVGEHMTDGQGIALRGLMIRHLVMPNRVAGTEKFTSWVCENLPSSTYVNIMAQYSVEYKAFDYPEIARGITVKEFLEAMEWAENCGLNNLDPQSISIRDIYRKR